MTGRERRSLERRSLGGNVAAEPSGAQAADNNEAVVGETESTTYPPVGSKLDCSSLTVFYRERGQRPSGLRPLIRPTYLSFQMGFVTTNPA
jgi:hypothetical protein